MLVSKYDEGRIIRKQNINPSIRKRSKLCAWQGKEILITRTVMLRYKGVGCSVETKQETRTPPTPPPPPFPIGCLPSEGPNRWRLHRHKRRELNKRFSPQCKTSTWLCWNTDVRIRLSATWTTCKYDTRRLSPPEIGIYRPSGTSHWRSCSRSIQRWCLPSARRSKQQT